MQDINYNDIKYQREHYGIYCIECVKTNTKYIGQTYENFYRRWIFHKWNLKNNHHSNSYLQNAWNKYGGNSFRIYPIESFELSQKDSITKEKLDELEEYYIKKFDTFKNGFNLTTGGEKCKMSPLSEESKRKIGEKNKINMLGKKHSDKTRKLMSEAHKGYIKSETHRENLSKSLTGFTRSEEQKEKCRIANQGSKQKTAKYTEEQIEKVKIDIINGIDITTISQTYNIPYNYIYSGIISDNRWKHVRTDGWDEFLENRKRKAI